MLVNHNYYYFLQHRKMNRSLCIILALMILLMSCKEKKRQPHSNEKNSEELISLLHEGSIEAYNEGLWEIVSKDAVIEIISGGHDWTEGPLWVESEALLLYSDIPRNAVYVWKEGQKSEIFLQPSGFEGDHFEGSEPGANGLLLDQNNDLVLCQHGNRQIAKMINPVSDPSPGFQILADRYDHKRLNSPNDAVYKRNGDLYFTDPPYGLPKQMDDQDKQLPFQGVYRLEPNGNVTLLTDEFTRPNGIAFSPDEKTLYVSNSDPEMAIWKSFDVRDNGLLENGRVFFDATPSVPVEIGLPDGLKVDSSGNLFATGPGGVFVFSPEGELLGKIKTGQATSNCAFNTDKSILFITADSYVLRVKF